MAHRQTPLAALLKEIRAKTSNSGNEVGKINFALIVQALFQMHRRDGIHDFIHPFAGRKWRVHGDQFAVDAEDDRRADLQMHVRCAAVNSGFKNAMKEFHTRKLTNRIANASPEKIE